MSDERLTDAQRERLLIGAQRLAELEQKLIEVQCELAEAARCFQFSDMTEPPAAEPQPFRIPSQAVVVGRDSRGEFLAMNLAGEVLYKSDAEMYVAPFTIWILDGNKIYRKRCIDQIDLYDMGWLL